MNTNINNKLSKIYVAGHRGLVGSAIVRNLQSKGYNNLILRTHKELDLINQQQVNDFFEKERPDYVFLCAAKVGGIMGNNNYPADFIYQNIMIGTNVIEASRKYGVKKLLNLGSSCIYPGNISRPMKESDLLTGPLEKTNEAYAIAKITMIKLCYHYNNQHKTNFISAMPTNQYGPGDNFNMETAHLLPMVMRRFHLAKLLSNNDFEQIKKDLKANKLGWDLDD
ncbi:MAG: NAD-dependent epimerase/dehydratase family protein, partial [Rickettsiales bacterium]|nr:NAD-dependent epimerase/dehydratase family protein [Rickettsiales bacterium]